MRVVRNPGFVKETGSVQLFIKDFQQFPIAEVTTGVTYLPTTGQLSQVSVVPENTIVSSLTNAEIAFLPDHPLPASSVIRVTFPSDSVIPDRDAANCQLLNTEDFGSGIGCSLTSNVLTLTDPF